MCTLYCYFHPKLQTFIIYLAPNHIHYFCNSHLNKHSFATSTLVFSIQPLQLTFPLFRLMFFLNLVQNFPPNVFQNSATKEEVLYGFIMIAKTTSTIVNYPKLLESVTSSNKALMASKPKHKLPSRLSQFPIKSFFQSTSWWSSSRARYINFISNLLFCPMLVQACNLCTLFLIWRMFLYTQKQLFLTLPVIKSTFFK